MPFHFRRLAGISSILPVNVPAWVKNEMQPKTKILARRDRRRILNEIDGQMLRLHRLRMTLKSNQCSSND
jgi:hypothetical protein